MKEREYYKMCIKKDDKYSEENIYMRVVSWLDTDVHQFENEQESIEYHLRSGDISIEMNFNNADKYITTEEFERLYGHDNEIENQNPIRMLDMAFGHMTFSQYHDLRAYNINGHLKTQNEFLDNVCNIINNNCECYVTWALQGNEDQQQEMCIDYMYDLRPLPSIELEEFISIYTKTEITTNYFFDFGCYAFEDFRDKYKNDIYHMLQHVHGPTCLKWDNNRGECGYCGTDYIEDMENGGYCNGIPEEVLELIEICMFCGPRTVMYAGQRDRIDYKIIHDIIKTYGHYWEPNKFENLVINYKFIQKNAEIFKQLNYSIEDYKLYYKNYNELQTIVYNYQILERWNKIKNQLASKEIGIGWWSDWNDEGYNECPPTEERITIINGGIYSNNKFAWLEVNKNDSNVWDIKDEKEDFTQLEYLNRKIDWDMDLLNNLEEIYK